MAKSPFPFSGVCPVCFNMWDDCACGERERRLNLIREKDGRCAILRADHLPEVKKAKPEGREPFGLESKQLKSIGVSRE